MIQVRDLTYNFSDNRSLIDNLSFELRHEEWTTILGPSGCGKSTLLRLICGLLEPLQGHISLDGTQVKEAHSHCAYAFQDASASLLNWLSALDNVALGIEENVGSIWLRQKLAARALSIAGLSVDDYQKFPNQLSGGMQQRVSLARCIAGNRSWWLLDEPFGALDYISRLKLQKDVLDIFKTSSKSPGVLLVTHNIDEAIRLSDRIIIVGKDGFSVIKDMAIENRRINSDDPTDSVADYGEKWQEIYSYLVDA